MNRLALIACWWSILVLVLASPVVAQQVPGFDTCKQFKIERLGRDHLKLTGVVECESGDMKFSADEIEIFTDTNRAVAAGNVVFSQGGNRIAADRADFDTKTRTGTFYRAAGTAVLAEKKNQPRNMFGSQEPDMYFYGEEIEKIGPDTYRVTRGGFTTCVQPTPRWDLTSGSVVLRVDHYAVLKNSVLRVKGVPMLYLPILYYPIKKDDRATGFLMPAYGTSTFRGFTLSNAFFWAINRSQDATFMHDWFSKTGQGFGGEYRYVAAPGSQGNARVYILREHETTYTNAGVTTTTPGRQSYEIRGGTSQRLGWGLTARGNVNYFSSITVHQTYQTNIYDASQRQRSFGGSLAGTWGAYNVNATFDRTEYFFGETSSTVYGGTPRISGGRAERPIPGTPLYFSLGGEYVSLLRENRSESTIGDSSLTRIGFSPALRAPFRKWQFLTINSSIAWNTTWWSRQTDVQTGGMIDVPINRRYFDMQSRIVGPVFNRIWNTPGNSYAEKFKHTIEPFVTLQRVTMIDNYDEIPKLEGPDFVLGGTTRISYGVTNRFLAKRRAEGGAGSAREFLSAGITQTYYSDARASQYDYSYSTSFRGRPPSNFSPIAITVRGAPTDRVNGTLRMEYDRQVGAFQSISANGGAAAGEWLQVSAGWSHRKTQLTQYLEFDSLNASTTLKTPSNRVGGSYSFNYDIGRRAFVQSRIIGYYNAQCCGFAVEYQTYNFPQFDPRFPVAQDNRFNFSFTLAGLGTFSNFFGALGGPQR